MQIRVVHDADLDIWPDCKRMTMGAPRGMEDEVSPAEVLRHEPFGDEIHVPWKPNEIDVMRLAEGGTVWLTVLGGLFPHYIEVK